MSGKHYMGDTEAEFLAWSENFVSHSSILRLTFGFSEAELLVLQDQHDEFKNRYAICQSDQRTTAQVRLKNAARATLKATERGMVNRLQVHPKITNEYRDIFRIPIHDTNPTPIPPPTAQVEADLVFPGIHLVELVNIRPVGGTAPHPKSDYGVRIYYGITGPISERDKFRVTAPPVSGNDLPHSVFTRKRKERFDFDYESGNTVYFCLRYENSKGEAGTFGPILHAVIP
jgi:hypothetical protein